VIKRNFNYYEHFPLVFCAKPVRGVRVKHFHKKDFSISFITPHLYCTVLYCTVLYCTVLYCTVLYCTVLYCTVLYCDLIISGSLSYCVVLPFPECDCRFSALYILRAQTVKRLLLESVSLLFVWLNHRLQAILSFLR